LTALEKGKDVIEGVSGLFDSIGGMDMAFKHILVPFDGSKPSIAALEKAVELAHGLVDVQLTVAHVVDLQPVYLGDISFSPPEGYQKQLQEESTTLLNLAEEKTRSLPQSEIIVLAGNPATAVLNYVEENECDLIIIGSRGLGTFKEFVLGSVSHEVVQHAKVPVLIVK
jgi:nucleotide-binding universal stress UspA family protein